MHRLVRRQERLHPAPPPPPPAPRAAPVCVPASAASPLRRALGAEQRPDQKMPRLFRERWAQRPTPRLSLQTLASPPPPLETDAPPGERVAGERVGGARGLGRRPRCRRGARAVGDALGQRPQRLAPACGAPRGSSHGAAHACSACLLEHGGQAGGQEMDQRAGRGL